VASRSKAWVYGRSLAGIEGSNPAGGGNIVCCQVEVSVTSRSFVQRGPTECECVHVCDQMQQESSSPTTAGRRVETKKETLSDKIDQASCKVKSLTPGSTK
jgi:hypothetical protein